MAPEASGWPIRPLCINSMRGGRQATKPLRRALLAKALIVYQTQGGGGDTQWREWAGAARIANPLIVWQIYRERPKFLRSPRRGSARRTGAHCRQSAPSTNPNLGDQSPRPPGIYRFRATAAPGNNERANVFWCCGGPKAVNPGGSGAKPPSACLRATHRISRTWDALNL